MNDTLTIRGVNYTVSPEQRERIEQIDEEMREEIMSAPLPEYDGTTIGNAPDPFKHIVDKHVKRKIDVALSR